MILLQAQEVFLLSLDLQRYCPRLHLVHLALLQYLDHCQVKVASLETHLG